MFAMPPQLSGPFDCAIRPGRLWSRERRGTAPLSCTASVSRAPGGAPQQAGVGRDAGMRAGKRQAGGDSSFSKVSGEKGGEGFK